MITQPARIDIDGRGFTIDLAAPHSIALVQDYSSTQPRWFGADAASCAALRAPGFSGRVAQGASCNASRLSLTPHGNGTHTECVGHLTRDAVNVRVVAPRQLLPALLLSLRPQSARASGEASDPPPQGDDLLITRSELIAAWPASLPWPPLALIVRTLPNTPGKRVGDYRRATPPYLSAEAIRWLIDQGIEHLLLDLPSVDRVADAGRLTAHRLFFGLPAGAIESTAAARAHCTITELCYIDDAVADGAWLLSLQLPELDGDALPSRPLLYRVRE